MVLQGTLQSSTNESKLVVIRYVASLRFLEPRFIALGQILSECALDVLLAYVSL